MPPIPHLNPIEFAFSKIKYLVKKSLPKTEIQLLYSIMEACRKITKEDAAEYIIHSIKFTKQAFHKEDFFNIYIWLPLIYKKKSCYF